MEILDHNITPLVMNIALVLTALSALLLMVITAVHWHAERHQKHAMAFDRACEPLVMSYLEGNTPKLSVIKSMEKDPSEAMNLLMKLSSKLQPAAQSRLLPLFAGLPKVDKEISALDSSHMKRRLQAAERLAYLKDDASAEALLHALKDEVLAVRYCAARSLAEHGNTEFIEPTLLAFDADHEINWLRLVEIVCTYGKPAAPTLLAVLENQDGKYTDSILNVAIRALGSLQEPEAVEPLIQLLDHSDYSVRLNAARALGEIGDPSAVAPVAELSHDPDWAVRNKAVEAIGKLHAEDQIPLLVESLTDSSWWVRFSAAQALYSLGPNGIETLRDVIKNTHDLYAHEMCQQVLSEHDLLDTNHQSS